MLYQQGDVLFKSVEQSRGKPCKKHPVVVAEGEATGHSHKILDDVRALVDGETMFIESDKPFTVVHEEHGAITIPAGIYEVDRVKEYDHFAEEARRVMD